MLTENEIAKGILEYLSRQDGKEGKKGSLLLILTWRLCVKNTEYANRK